MIFNKHGQLRLWITFAALAAFGVVCVFCWEKFMSSVGNGWLYAGVFIFCFAVVGGTIDLLISGDERDRLHQMGRPK